MSDDRIQYDLLALDAMRGVIRAVLHRVQRRGIPGDHHFYISFFTQAPGVQISKRLKDRYPVEMTIVIQHQFWDLQVWDDRFEVKLSFNNVPERLVIPFAAIRRFHDPSVDFGFNLQVFEQGPQAGAMTRVLEPALTIEPAEGRGEESVPAPVPALPQIADQSARPERHLDAAKPADKPQKPGAGQKSAEIVKLDSFRKK